MLYFETQDEKARTCVLCALNNCLQEKKATARELDTIALHLAITEAACAGHFPGEHVGKKLHSVSDYYRHLSKMGLDGGWSIRTVRWYLTKKKIAHEWDVKVENPAIDLLTGRYFIRTRVGDSVHAIAIVEGQLLDSLCKEPMPWTGDPRYAILLICRVYV